MQERMYFSQMYIIAPVSANGIYMHIQGQLYSMNWKTDGQRGI